MENKINEDLKEKSLFLPILFLLCFPSILLQITGVIDFRQPLQLSICSKPTLIVVYFVLLYILYHAALLFFLIADFFKLIPQPFDDTNEQTKKFFIVYLGIMLSFAIIVLPFLFIGIPSYCSVF